MQNYELILLRSDDICLDSFLSLVVNNEVVNADTNSDVVGKEFCQDLVSVLDTEWDRRIFRVFAACGRSNSEFTALGFKSDLRNSDRTKVESVIYESKKLDDEAEKLVLEGLESKKEKLEARVKKLNRIMVGKQHKWTATQLGEHQEEIDDLRESILNTELFIKKDENKKKALVRMIRRKKNYLIDIRRMKKRKNNGGRKQLLTEDDERYIAQCIANKSTAHGR